MLEAKALLIAASKKVACGGGLARLLRGRRERLRVSKKKNVREGFSVSTSEAE